ncbi:Girdin, partial [Fasciolopsis buskii]
QIYCCHNWHSVSICSIAQAHQERGQILLLLLCAAVRCDRRDHFIRQIMDRLTPDVQTGIMDCIKNFTENPECVVSFDQMESSAPDILRTLKMCINQLEDVYLEVRVRTTNNTIPFFFYNFFRYQLSIW